MSTKREAAHIAARRGLNVFPIRPYVHPGDDATPDQLLAAAKGAKAPLIANWQNQATQDPQQIDAWWDEWPDANLACTTENLIVVDVDPRHQGDETMLILLDLFGLPSTLRSETQGGGDHLIYAAPNGPVKGGTNKLGRGVDIKARGGYILLPGSTIEDRAYKWWNSKPIAPAPQWIVDQCNAAKPKTDTAGQRVVEEDDQARQLAEQWIEQRAPRAQLGEIDDTTFKVAARLGDFGCGFDTVHELMLGWNETHCDGLGDIERLAVVCESACRNRENAIGSKHPQAPGFDAIEIDESAKPRDIEPTAAEPGLKTKFFALRADEGARLALAHPGEPLIKGVVHCGAMSVLIGPPGEGKTFLALDWAYHIATGKPWAGKRTKQGAVVYLAAEAGTMINTRLAALEAHYGALGAAPLYVIPCSADFAHGAEDAKAVLALIRDVESRCSQKVELFVVDTLARAISGGDENSSKDMGAVIKAIDFIRTQVGCHVTVIHHPSKAGTGGGRGHSSVLGGTDTEMQLADHTLTFTKQRDMVKGADIKFKLMQVKLGKDEDGEDITSCVVQVRGAHDAEPRADLTGRLRDVWDTLDAALSDASRTTFDMAFLRKIDFRHSSDNGPTRVTLIGWMSELSESGYLKKHARGQWVVANVGNVGLMSE